MNKKHIKYACALSAGFLFCPCPIHGTALGLALVGALKGADLVNENKEKKEEG